MSKAEQVLKLEPSSELRFRGPFTKVVTANLKLTNLTEKKVCFNVKTTAPRRYCVRPNKGFVEPRGVVELAVELQPFVYDPKQTYKHKFMVLAMFAPEGEVNHETLWIWADRSACIYYYLKCVFDYVEDSERQTVVLDSSTGANEETVRLRKNVAQVSSPAQVSTDSVPTQQTNVTLPLLALADFVLGLIFGVIIGKFIL